MVRGGMERKERTKCNRVTTRKKKANLEIRILPRGAYNPLSERVCNLVLDKFTFLGCRNATN